MLRACAIAAALATACSAGTSATPPAQPALAPPPADAAVADAPALDHDLPRLVARSLAMYRDVAAALAAVDCPAATTRLDQLAATYREVVAANAAVLHDGRAAELRAALAPHDDELTTSAAAVIHAPAMAACVSDPAFTHALDQLFAAP